MDKKIVIERSVVNKINYILDNWVPPVLRDNDIVMSILLSLALGRKNYRFYMGFKDKLPFYKEKDINRYYSILSDTFMDRKTDLNYASMLYILDSIKGKNILDAAAGKGYLAKILKHKGKNVTALDIVLPKQRNKEIKYVRGSLTKLPFENDTFDTVICTHALEHIKYVKEAVEELRRVCKERLIIVIPRQREYRYTFDLHINFYPYLYCVERLLNNENAVIKLIDNDWVCVENFD